jgi:Cu+-exporting ATPase
MVGSGRGAEMGVLFKNAEVFERAKGVDTVVFDKTGTLTRGAMTLVDVVTEGGRAQFLRMAGTLESGSEHPIGKAVVLGAEEAEIELGVVEDFESIRGKGAHGTVDGTRVVVGKPVLFTESGFAGIDHWMEPFTEVSSKGNTTFLVGWDDQVQGVLSVADTVRPTSEQAIRDLTGLGISTVMLTGDSRHTANAIAVMIGIDQVVAEVLPGEKSAAVSGMQANGQVVAFVGDGINDAPALTVADLGMAVGSGTDVAMEAGDIVLMSGDPVTCVTAIRLARKTFITIRQNLFWAFAYNAAAIPLAALGFLNPMVAAAAMAFSSVSVVSNSVRLRKFA